jgi:DnaJ domain
LDAYKTLGLQRGATRSEIRKAYLRLARRFHPDRNRRKGAVEKFLEIRRAYETLLAAPPAPRVTAPPSRDMSELDGVEESSLDLGLLGIRIRVGFRVG